MYFISNASNKYRTVKFIISSLFYMDLKKKIDLKASNSFKSMSLLFLQDMHMLTPISNLHYSKV